MKVLILIAIVVIVWKVWGDELIDVMIDRLFDLDDPIDASPQVHYPHCALCYAFTQCYSPGGSMWSFECEESPLYELSDEGTGNQIIEGEVIK